MPDTKILQNLIASDTMAEVEAAVSHGEYESVGHVLQEALDDWSARRRLESIDPSELRRLVQEGVESGPGIEAQQVFAEIRAKYNLPR